ncbi:MAG TPA: ArsA family ATPase [Syntrophales bacterium]|nr:ArsA family ATPase [Syntrophales bacterium]
MRIHFFTGKGGVGKSTMAAAAAWQLSQGARVLIVSLDPAHNLGDIFGIELKNRRKAFSRNLHLEEVDLHRLAKDYLKRESRVLNETYHYLQTLNLDRYFSILQYSPGIEEYALLTAIERTIREADGFDHVVFDTPPTGLTLRFLALPLVTVTWIERLMAIRRHILEKRHTIQKIRNPASRSKAKEIRLKYDEEGDDILDHLKTLRANFASLTGTLQGADCGVTVVFNPDLLSLRESQRLLEGLRDLKLPLRLLILNKITTENGAAARQVTGAIKALAGGGVHFVNVSWNPSLGMEQGGRLFEIPEDLTVHLSTR